MGWLGLVQEGIPPAAMLVQSVTRSRLMAVRPVAMTWGPEHVRSWWRSSSKTASANASATTSRIRPRILAAQPRCRLTTFALKNWERIRVPTGATAARCRA